MPEGEEKEQEIGNLLEKIMKENFFNLVKEIDMQVQVAERIPNNGCKRPTPRHIIISPGWCKSVDSALVYELKHLWFDSLSGHMPGLQARSPVWGI